MTTAKVYPSPTYGDTGWPLEVWHRFDLVKPTAGPVVVYFGSNESYGIGVLTKYYDRPSCAVYTAEPQPECIAFLEKVHAVDERVHVVPYAVSNFDGEAKFYKNVWNVTSSLRMFTPRCFGIGAPREFHETTVPVRRIDSLIACGMLPHRADLIILDVQGSELEVIQGGEDFFAKSSMVFAEVTFEELYVGEALYETVRDKLIALGFTAEREATNEDRQRQAWTDILFTKDQDND